MLARLLATALARRQNGSMRSTDEQAGSARKRELLDRAYAYVLKEGLSDLSLRPLATAIGSSPRVLLFLFGSKDDLIRALLARARRDELEALEALPADPGSGPADACRTIWAWLSDPAHQALLRLWLEGYSRSLIDTTGPWSGFATATVTDWLAVLGSYQRPQRRRSRAGEAERTLLLAILRGALLDLLATGDTERVTRAVDIQLEALRQK
jgi:AcrR family transcriptional regulator